MLATRPREALALAEQIVASPDASSELVEATLLTLDEEAWGRARAAHQLAVAQATGEVRTGTFFDQLESETGGEVTAEALEAFMARMKAGG